MDPMDDVDVVITTQTPTDALGLDAYEAAFAHDLRHSSRALRTDPWVAGVAHVFLDLPAQLEPVVTGGVDMYQVLLLHTDLQAREYVRGRRPHVDGLIGAGRLNLYIPGVAREQTYTTWTTPRHDSTGFMLSHATLASVAADMDRDYGQVEFLERYNHEDDFLAALTRALGDELVAGAAGGRVYAEQLLHAAAAHVLRHHSVGGAAKTRTGGLPPRSLRRVREYAAAHLPDRDLALADLAAAAGYSPWHFARALRASTGETPAELVWRLRTDRAAELLSARPRPTVAAVAEAVGYGSAAGFSRAFKRRWGVGPGRWGK